MSGFSRGGATVNLAAGLLDRGIDLCKDWSELTDQARGMYADMAAKRCFVGSPQEFYENIQQTIR